jgi:non-specific serine/threonine protein kinase
VAAVLGVREDPGRPLLASLTSALQGRRLLLFLDNWEHLVLACAEAATMLLRGCAQLQILATSREALGVTGEHAWKVPSLALPDEQPPSSPGQLLTVVTAAD